LACGAEKIDNIDADKRRLTPMKTGISEWPLDLIGVHLRSSAFEIDLPA
jgi:hypothetical protein